MNVNDQNELLCKLFRQAALPVDAANEPSPDDTSHPVNDDELLVRWSLDDLEEGEHERIVAHLGDCGYCRRELAAMLRAGALTLPEDEAAEPAPDTISIRDARHHASPNRRLLFVGTAVAASLLVAVIWGLSEQDAASMVAMARHDLEAGRHAAAMQRMEKYLDENEGLDAKDRTEAGRILEESGYRIAHKEFTDSNGKNIDRVLAIEERVSSRAGSSARLLNLRLQAERGDNHELSLSSSGTLLAYGIKKDGFHKDAGIKSIFSDPPPTHSETTRRLENEFIQAIQKHPDSLDLRLNYGQFLLEQNDYKQAAQQFAAAEKLNSTSTLAQTGLGLALFRQDTDQSIKKALKHFRRAVELSPEDLAANLNLAVCLTRLDRKKEAGPYFQKATGSTEKQDDTEQDLRND